jgi:hypothetical protein
VVDDWLPFVLLAGFVVLLGVVAYLRVRNAARMASWVVETMDGSTRRVGALALVPGIAVAVVAIVDGLEPPTGVLFGLVCALGCHIALLGALGMEGALLEKDSEAKARIAERRPPPSSPRGRVVAMIVGVLIAAASVTPFVLS